ncbi:MULTISPECIES: ABC transporter permease [unclassified Staphylococcus]|uniref:ABC transporter permease n=1 Tax=unclassified Staphylococcus TaxID=91994 RepID=UPI0021CFA3FD|nr:MULTISPECIES: ABC transporter permease [unclassified Staphylococcus]UXR78240.1 ABC transporter permease [Staphylococcus sp. IVB6227]UXR82404.1 ABC transporter permease [Staphylococcus sp. IVB6214]
MLFLKSQFLKMKHTSIVPIMIGLPILTVAMFSCLALFAKQTDAQIFRITALQIFLEIVFPVTITLIIGLMFRIERRHHAFQNTLIYFKSLRAYYMIHFVFYVFVGILMLLFAYVTYIVGYFIFVQEVEIDSVYLMFIWSVVLLPVVSFIYMLSHLFQGFVLPAVISLLLTIGNFFVGVIGIYASHFYFYSFLVFTLYNGYNIFIIMLISLLLSVLFLMIGYFKFLKSMEKGIL